MIELSVDISSLLEERKKQIKEDIIEGMFDFSAIDSLICKHSDFISKNGFLSDIPEDDDKKSDKYFDNQEKYLREKLFDLIDQIINYVGEE